MSAVLTAAPAKRGSLRQDRRKALYWSYFFLILFAVFFLTPPLYMLITSLKTSGEISAARMPWWVFDPTLSNYTVLILSVEYQTFFLNSAMVALATVVVTMLISIPAAFALARMKFWGSTALATGVFLTYLIPETLLFIPLFKIFAWVTDVTGIELINHWWVLIIIYPTLTVPFCTWIMIGYFASIPNELDEAALIDGASWLQVLLRIFIPLALPGQRRVRDGASHASQSRESLRADPGGEGHRTRHPGQGVRGAGRPLRLWKDDHLAHDRRPRRHHLGRDLDRRRGGERHPTQGP